MRGSVLGTYPKRKSIPLRCGALSSIERAHSYSELIFAVWEGCRGAVGKVKSA